MALSRARKKLIILGDKETFIKRISVTDKNIKGNDSISIASERKFFEKLIQYIEGYGEFKKAFHVWSEEDETI